MTVAIRIICLTMLLAVFSARAGAEDFTNAICAFLQRRVEVEKRDVGIVIGIVDERGSKVVSCGKLDNGTDGEVNGDTLFELGSITKTFTALLLEEMVERGEMKLDDLVAKYLPASVTMPTCNGKGITLRQLATHTSGLPLLPDNLDPKRADNPYADYTVEKMFAFLSRYKLSREPGTKYRYSELGMELLGYVVALKAGTNYESLVVDRICRPLEMDSTRITLTPELRGGRATGHDELGHAVPALDFQGLTGGSGLHSTANDLLKYLSANLGFTPSSLTPSMEKTHTVQFQNWSTGLRMGLAWAIVYLPAGREYVMHGGGTPGFTTFLAFDKNRRRGVVILSSSNDLGDVGLLGLWLLESEWNSGRRPTAADIGRQGYGSCVGEYGLSPDFALGILTLRGILERVPVNMAIGIGACACFVILLLVAVLRRVALIRRLCRWRVFRWRAFRLRTRRIVVACVIAVLVSAIVITPLVTARVVCALTHPVVDVWREGDRLFVQGRGAKSGSGIASVRITGELLPQSETRFFERLSGALIRFDRDAQGKVTGFTAPVFGSHLSFNKVSDRAPEPPAPRVAIRLEPKLYDVIVGQYQFPVDDLFPDGIRLTIGREGDRLVGHASSTNGGWGDFDIYAESETNFFFTINAVGVRLIFTKNERGEVTSITRRVARMPDQEGKRLKNTSE